jgi:hypothetical protein
MTSDCSPARISELKRRCQETLRDVRETIVRAEGLYKDGHAKALEALKPGSECVKGAYDILKAAAKDCNPYTPGTDPTACAETLLGIPDTVKACRQAYKLATEALDLYRQAIDFYGAAEVAFGEQGGYEIAAELRACNESACHGVALALEEYARSWKERARRDRERVEAFRDNLKAAEDALTKCKADHNQCIAFPQVNVPELEGPGGAPPDTVLP